MSYAIVYQMQAVRFPAESIDDYDDKILILHESGSNNCYEAGNRRRARDWQASHFGPAYRVIAGVCEHAGSCEGGGLTFSGSIRTTPEAYIKRHRKIIAEAAVGIAGAEERGFRLDGRIRLLDNYKKHEWLLKELREVRQDVADEDNHPDQERPVRLFHFDLHKADDLKIWAKYAENVERDCLVVYGPSTSKRDRMYA